VVTHQLQVERRTWKVRQSETDVLPLCYATNLIGGAKGVQNAISDTFRHRKRTPMVAFGWQGTTSYSRSVVI